MSMNKDDRSMLISMLNDLGVSRLNDAGATARQIAIFIKHRNLTWEDLIVDEIKLEDMIITPDNEHDFLKRCLAFGEHLTEFEREFVSDNVEKIKLWGNLT